MTNTMIAQTFTDHPTPNRPLPGICGPPDGAQAKVDGIGVLLTELKAAFHKLVVKLEPVLTYADTALVADATNSYPSNSSPLCKSLGSVELTLRNFDADLRSLLSRVDL